MRSRNGMWEKGGRVASFVGMGAASAVLAVLLFPGRWLADIRVIEDAGSRGHVNTGRCLVEVLPEGIALVPFDATMPSNAAFACSVSGKSGQRDINLTAVSLSL